MAPSTIRKALGAVKDRTSIGLAKVSSNGSVASELDVAIVKATRHDEFPAEERHVREILSLTCYSRAYVARCVAALSRRLGRTRSWAVALKTLILVHRLLAEGDPAYEQEVFFATRRGTRMLNMSDFRDTSRSDAWDFSAFVRTYALYLDERLEYRMHGRRGAVKPRGGRGGGGGGGGGSALYGGDEEREQDQEDEAAAAAATTAVVLASRGSTPVREMKVERIFVRAQHLQQLLERFLACRPTGAAKANRIVAVALYPLVKESFQIYYDLAEAMSALIDRFTDLDVSDCARVHHIFVRLAKQLDELDAFYAWCKSAAVCRPSEFPDVERITARKLDLMDDFIREKSAAAKSSASKPLPLEGEDRHEEHRENLFPEDGDDDAYADMSNLRALPAPEEKNHDGANGDEGDDDGDSASTSKAEAKVEEGKESAGEADLLNLQEDVMSGEEHGDKLALALFDGSGAAAAPRWEAFDESADWETALVQSASGLSGQKASLGGGLDMTLLDGMYGHAQASAAAAAASVGYSGSASSVAIRAPPPQATMLALPAPPTVGGGIGGDPFASSATVPPPAYVQMSDMEKKQGLLVEEQQMWRQYARNGMQGQMSLPQLQQQQQPTAMAAQLTQPPQNGAYYYYQSNVGGFDRMY